MCVPGTKGNYFYFFILMSILPLQVLGQDYISYVQDCNSKYDNLEWIESTYLRNLSPEAEYLEKADIQSTLHHAQKKLSQFSPYMSKQVFQSIETLKKQTRIVTDFNFLLPPVNDNQILKPGCVLKILGVFQGHNLFIQSEIWQSLTVFQKVSFYLIQGLYQSGIQYPLASRLFVSYWLSGELEKFTDYERSEFYKKVGLKYFEVQFLRVNLNEGVLSFQGPRFFESGEIKSGYALDGSIKNYENQSLKIKGEFLFYRPNQWAFFNLDVNQLFIWKNYSFILKKISFFKNKPNQIQSIQFLHSLDKRIKFHPRFWLELKDNDLHGYSPLQVDFYESGNIEKIEFLSPPWEIELDLRVQTIKAGVPLELRYRQSLTLLLSQEGEIRCVEGIYPNQNILWQNGDTKLSPYFQNLCFSPEGMAQGNY